MRLGSICFLIYVAAEAQQTRPDLIPDLQQFEKDSGFQATRNFKTQSSGRPAYFLCYAADILALPDSYNGLKLVGATEGGCKDDPSKHDLFFYRVEALAGNAQITPELVNATDERQLVVVAHEDFHTVMHEAPAPVSEAAATLIGFLTAAEFAKTQFGDQSEQFVKLSQEPELFLRKAELIRIYHGRLKELYASVRKTRMSTAEALAKKQKLFNELGKQCAGIVPEPRSFNRCPAVLNNAGLAFDMTYARDYPATYEIYLTHKGNLKETIEAMKGLARNRVAIEANEPSN